MHFSIQESKFETQILHLFLVNKLLNQKKMSLNIPIYGENCYLCHIYTYMVIVIDFLDAYLGVGSTGMWVKLPAARAI